MVNLKYHDSLNENQGNLGHLVKHQNHTLNGSFYFFTWVWKKYESCCI